MRALLLICLCAATVQAQVLTGVVRDSVSRAGIPGVVVSVVDSGGRSVARALSDHQGGYRVLLPESGNRLRVQRLGFRLRELTLRGLIDERPVLDISLVALPSLLERVNVVGAAKCPRRRDNAQAQALYEQARAGLLATLVARESNPASVVRYTFERPVLQWPDSAVTGVRIDSTTASTTSFRSVFSGEEFVQFGFQRRVGDKWQYFGPDAEVLLDEGFAAGYCFGIADRDRSRRSQIGLTFAASAPLPGRVDIVGTLWIDTIARALRTIEYKYTGMRGLAGFFDSGGRTSFVELPNGVVIVSQWGVQLLNIEADSFSDRFGNRVVRPRMLKNEGGGYLARATWPDGTRWEAPMGGARLRLMLNDTTPVRNIGVHLARTDFRGRTDSAGYVEFADLFPARYRVIVNDTLLESMGFELEPQFDFVATPGAVIDVRARVQSTAEQLLRRCHNRTSKAEYVAVVNVKDAAVGAPDVKVDVTINGHTMSETTRSLGNIVLCFDRNALGANVQLVGSRGNQKTQTIVHTINRRVTLFQLQLAPKP